MRVEDEVCPEEVSILLEAGMGEVSIPGKCNIAKVCLLLERCLSKNCAFFKSCAAELDVARKLDLSEVRSLGKCRFCKSDFASKRAGVEINCSFEMSSMEISLLSETGADEECLALKDSFAEICFVLEFRPFEISTCRKSRLIKNAFWLEASIRVASIWKDKTGKVSRVVRLRGSLQDVLNFLLKLSRILSGIKRMHQANRDNVIRRNDIEWTTAQLVTIHGHWAPGRSSYLRCLPKSRRRAHVVRIVANAGTILADFAVYCGPGAVVFRSCWSTSSMSKMRLALGGIWPRPCSP